jgi:hypothetical protein
VERKFVRDVVQTAFRHANILRHRAIDAIAETAASGIEVVETTAAQRRPFVNDSRSFADSAIAFFEPTHAATKSSDGTGELVAKDARVIDRPGVRALPLMQITAANANRPDPKQYIVFTDFGDGNFAQLN